uniref:Uncharacterized protein n=1 Tax=Knipowitschia caucasica TaxID=637954 RepID=A0AAV2MN81_KNICA
MVWVSSRWISAQRRPESAAGCKRVSFLQRTVGLEAGRDREGVGCVEAEEESLGKHYCWNYTHKVNPQSDQNHRVSTEVRVRAGRSWKEQDVTDDPPLGDRSWNVWGGMRDISDLARDERDRHRASSLSSSAAGACVCFSHIPAAQSSVKAGGPFTTGAAGGGRLMDGRAEL